MRSTERLLLADKIDFVNNQSPLVSIVIPVYNGMPFIVHTIESVRFQTYDNWELLICDNDSTDRTIDLVKQYLDEKPDQRIRVISHQEHLSMARNWNRSLTYAQGELIKLLPSDDVLLPECIDIQVRLLREQSDIGFVTSGKEVIDHSGKKLFTRSPLKEGKYDWHSAGLKSLYAITNLFGEPGGVLFRKELLKCCGGYDPSLNYFVDIELLLRFLKKTKVSVWGKPLYQFRIHGSSVSAASRQLSVCEYLHILDSYEKDLKLSEKPSLKYYLKIKAHFLALLRSLIFQLYAKAR